MLKRYVGPDGEVRVVVAGTEIGIVKNGESIAVPDDVAELTVWPDTLWQDDAEKKPASKSKSSVSPSPASNDSSAANESDK